MTPVGSTSTSTSATEGVNVMEPVTEVPEGWTFLRAAAQKGVEDGGLGAHCDMLRSRQRHMLTCHCL